MDIKEPERGRGSFREQAMPGKKSRQESCMMKRGLQKEVLVKKGAEVGEPHNKGVEGHPGLFQDHWKEAREGETFTKRPPQSEGPAFISPSNKTRSAKEFLKRGKERLQL